MYNYNMQIIIDRIMYLKYDPGCKNIPRSNILRKHSIAKMAVKP